MFLTKTCYGKLCHLSIFANALCGLINGLNQLGVRDTNLDILDRLIQFIKALLRMLGFIYSR